MQEIIVYRDYGRIIRWQQSDENGVFTDRVHLDTGGDEGPRLMIYSTMFGFDKVRVLEGEIKGQFLAYEYQIKELQARRNALIETNWDKLPALTWEWMRQHQDPTVQTPEPFQHKKTIVNLRKGSKIMVDGSTYAVRCGVAGLVGRLKRKGKKWATVDFEGRLRYVPYTVLLPYDYKRWLEEKKRIPHSQRLNIMSNKVAKELNKILF